jgi:hypothetical protein
MVNRICSKYCSLSVSTYTPSLYGFQSMECIGLIHSRRSGFDVAIFRGIAAERRLAARAIQVFCTDEQSHNAKQRNLVV